MLCHDEYGDDAVHDDEDIIAAVRNLDPTLQRAIMVMADHD